MTQAENAPTTSRVSFASLGARRARHAAILPAVQVAHGALIASLIAETPHAIHGYKADRFDLIERRDHLKTILAAVAAYAKAIVGDTANMAPVNIDDETGYLKDAAAEITAAMNTAVDKMLDEADEANPGAWLKARQAEVAR